MLGALPDARHEEEAGLLVWPPEPPETRGELVVVACAGTSDLPVAREAALTAKYLGRRTELVVDIGIAGLHRTLARLDLLRSAGCIVVAAGMDGALPGLVAGLVGAPVIAVPTSVGYGASFHGLSALLSAALLWKIRVSACRHVSENFCTQVYKLKYVKNTVVALKLCC